MASSPIIILCTFFIFLFHLQSTRGNKQVICNTLRCGDIDIKFPFGLKGSNQDRLCWYYPIKSFHLSCINQTQPIVNIPGFGNLIVKSINYEFQSIQVNDPEGCLPKRFLHKWNLSESPFILNPSIYGASPFNLTFMRCPSNVTDPSKFPLTPISCLSDNKNNYSVIASWSQPIMLSQWCQVMSQALFPVQVMDMPMPLWSFWGDLTDDLHLLWTQPSCINCALSAQDCAFSNHINKTLQVACFPRDSTKGLSRSAKYGIAIGAGIPGLLCLIGVSCFICGKIRMLTHRRSSTDLPLSISLEPIPFVMGLDGATIEKYPKTLIGESGRLLKPSDNTCAICLSEYQPKETLRSIPECNHYFHADCIDEWLKLNATCPLCRNSPELSSTPSFFSSSSTSSPQ